MINTNLGKSSIGELINLKISSLSLAHTGTSALTLSGPLEVNYSQRKLFLLLMKICASTSPPTSCGRGEPGEEIEVLLLKITA